MNRTVYIASCVIVLILSVAIFTTGVAFASTEGTGSSASYGPIYKWLSGDDSVNNSVNYESYGMDRDPQNYFNGGYTDPNVAFNETIERIILSRDDIDSVEELNQEVDEDLVEALGGRNWQENEDGSLYKMDQLGRAGRYGEFQDFAYTTPPTEDIETWNENNVTEWDHHRGSDVGDTVIPEHKAAEDDITTKIEASGRGFDWVPIQDAYSIIYSNDPSVWVHKHRHMNIDSSQGNPANDTGNLFDDSMHLIGEDGTVRLVYDYRFYSNHPKKFDILSEPSSAGLTDWYYEDPSMEISDYSAYMTTTGSPCIPQCGLTTSENTLSDGSKEIEWEIPSNPALGGEQVEFHIEAEITYTLDRQNVESVRDGCEETDEDGDCVEYDYDWEETSDIDDYLEESTRMSDSELYTVSNGFGQFGENADYSVEKAQFSNGRTEYYVTYETQTESGDTIPWSRIQLGETNKQAVNKWDYFSSRHKGWDELYSQPTEEYTPSTTLSQAIQNADATEYTTYSSSARPLELHTYPAHTTYNTGKSSVLLTDPERTAVETESVASPALIAHERCVQNYVDEQRDQSFDGDQPGLEFSQRTTENPQGSYEYHEPCYWMYTPATEGTPSFKTQYVELPHRVVPDGDVGFFSRISQIFFGGNELEYSEYIFERELSELLAVDLGTADPEDAEGLSQYQLQTDTPAIGSGSYNQINGVVMESRTTDVDTIQIYNIVPDQEPVQVEIPEENTVDPQPTAISTTVPEVEYEGEIVNPAETTAINEFEVELELYTVDEDGTKQAPVYTGDNEDEFIKIYNASELPEDRGYKKINTNENGIATVTVDASDGNLIDAEFQPIHWSVAENPLETAVTDRTTQTADPNFLQDFGGILIIIYAIVFFINFALSNLFNIKFEPGKVFFDEFAARWLRAAIIFAIVGYVLTLRNDIGQVWLFLFALWIIALFWNYNSGSRRL